MNLAVCMDKYPTETRADLQRFFGLDIDLMGESFSHEHAAACIACVPMGSALMARFKPGYELLLGDLPVKAIADAFSRGDGKNALPALEGLPEEEFEEWLNQEWKEVDSSGINNW